MLKAIRETALFWWRCFAHAFRDSLQISNTWSGLWGPGLLWAIIYWGGIKVSLPDDQIAQASVTALAGLGATWVAVLIVRFIRAPALMFSELAGKLAVLERGAGLASFEIPDLRVADDALAVDLFEDPECDKLFPLLESEQLTAWGRTVKGQQPLTRIPSGTWKDHFFVFREKSGKGQINQTYVKSKARYETTYYDVHLNRSQIDRVWPVFGRKKLSDVEEKIGAFWQEGAILTESNQFQQAAWAERVHQFLTDAKLRDEAVMFITLSSHHDRMNKLRRIWGRAAHRVSRA